MNKSEENFYEESFLPMKTFIGRKKKKFSSQENFFFSQENFFLPKKTFSSSFVIDATDRQLNKSIKLNYIFGVFCSFLTFKTFYF